MKLGQKSQAMVEFALVAPIFLALCAGLADMGRGLLAYEEIAIGSRTGAREAVLQYNVGSNTKSPSCYPSTCTVPGVMPAVDQVASFGFGAPSYSDASSSSTAPSYCGASSNPAYSAGGTALPLTLTPPTTNSVNTIYACIYEYDPASSSGSAYWATSSIARESGHQMAVIDLNIQWTSVTLSLLGIKAPVNLDSQTVQRIEY